MLTKNLGIDEAALASLVGVGALEFLPVGADSWNYRDGERFINVREASGQRKAYSRIRNVTASLRAAQKLHAQHGLEFILAPVEILPFGRFVVSTYPYLNGTISWQDPRPLQGMVRSWLDRLHATSLSAELASEDFIPDYVTGLQAALNRIGSDAGPFTTRVAQAVDPARITGQLEAHLAHGAELRAREIPLVITHGEPVGNVMLVDDGSPYLVDLGDLSRAPRERDLRELGGGDPELIAYYRRDYALSEVTEYTDRLTRPHAGDAEDARAWYELGVFLAEL